MNFFIKIRRKIPQNEMSVKKRSTKSEFLIKTEFRKGARRRVFVKILYSNFVKKNVQFKFESENFGRVKREN